MNHHTVTTEESGTRLDHLLTALVSRPRSQVQKIIKEGCVQVNDALVAVHHFLHTGDRVTWTMVERTTNLTPNSTLDIPILFEDDELLVIEKPVGVIVHPAARHPAPDTIVHWLLAHVPTIVGIGSDPNRPGIVHRLDRDVSGVMVIAKTQVMYDHLVAAFTAGTVTKTYEAIVSGQCEKGETIIRFPIARSMTKSGKVAARPTEVAPSHYPSGRERTARVVTSDEKDATTRIETMTILPHATHIRAMPETGRRHQIRAHCAAIGHPVVGDTLYATAALHPERAPRLFLHSTHLRFVDPHGVVREFASPLPPAFTEFLERSK